MRTLLIIVIAILPTLSYPNVTPDTIKRDMAKHRRSGIEKLAPEYYSLHYAGNVAFLAAGAGYFNRSGKFQYGMMYGYTPRFAAGIRIHSLTIKSVLHLYRFQFKRASILPYAGLAANLEVGGR